MIKSNKSNSHNKDFHKDNNIEVPEEDQEPSFFHYFIVIILVFFICYLLMIMVNFYLEYKYYRSFEDYFYCTARMALHLWNKNPEGRVMTEYGWLPAFQDNAVMLNPYDFCCLLLQIHENNSILTQWSFAHKLGLSYPQYLHLIEDIRYVKFIDKFRWQEFLVNNPWILDEWPHFLYPDLIRNYDVLSVYYDELYWLRTKVICSEMIVRFYEISESKGSAILPDMIKVYSPELWEGKKGIIVY